MLPKLTWPQVTLFLGMFAIAVGTAAVLIVLDKPVEALISLVAFMGVPVLTAAGAAFYQKLDHVKEISNGNLADMREMLKVSNEQIARLALRLPAETNPDILNPVSPAATQEFTPWSK